MKSLACLLLLFLPVCSAQAEDILLIRPHLGAGRVDSGAYSHTGMRVLLSANAEKKYGLELTRVSTPLGDYLATGIVLEQKKIGWFNMSIGSIAYLGQGNTPNLPGLVNNLGWEPETTSLFKPFITMRNDVLFDKEVRSGIALSAGLSASF